MALYHATIGTTADGVLRNFNTPLENVTLTSIALSILAQPYLLPCLSFQLGLTPRGDQDVEVYHTLIAARIGPRDGANWSGSIRLRDLTYLVLNYRPAAALHMMLSWTTTGA